MKTLLRTRQSAAFGSTLSLALLIVAPALAQQAQAPAKPAPAQPAPAQPAPAQPAPAQPAPAQPAPAQPAPAQPAPAQPAPAQPAPAQPAPAQPAPAQPAPAQPAPAQPAPAQPDASAPEATGEATPTATEPAPAEPAPATAAPVAGAQSASANQGTEPPQDDYAGATDDALVEPKPGKKNLVLGVALDLTMPMGSAGKFVSNASIQGLSLDLRYYAFGNIGIGAAVAFDSASKKTSETVEWGNSTVSGTQVRELSYTPITLKGYYAWRDSEKFIPYVAVGAGAARSVQRLFVGFSALSEASWHFAVVPEVGIHIPAGPTMVLTNARISYLPKSGGTDDQLFANISLGLAIQ